MGHVCCMGMIMGLCLVFYVFFCKPVDVVEGTSLRACCSDGGVCNAHSRANIGAAIHIIKTHTDSSSLCQI